MTICSIYGVCMLECVDQIHFNRLVHFISASPFHEISFQTFQLLILKYTDCLFECRITNACTLTFCSLVLVLSLSLTCSCSFRQLCSRQLFCLSKFKQNWGATTHFERNNWIWFIDSVLFLWLKAKSTICVDLGMQNWRPLQSIPMNKHGFVTPLSFRWTLQNWSAKAKLYKPLWKHGMLANTFWNRKNVFVIFVIWVTISTFVDVAAATERVLPVLFSCTHLRTYSLRRHK